MNALATEYGVSDLLERAGVRLRGRNRADCPRCGGKRTVSYTEEVFYCHHAGCDFHGNRFSLARELGLTRRLSPAEDRVQLEERRNARVAAQCLAEWVKERRLGLNAAHRECLDLIRLAHEAGPCESAWEGLAVAYETLPKVRAELLALEDADAAGALAILTDGPERERLLFQPMCLDDGPAGAVATERQDAMKRTLPGTGQITVNQR